MGEPTRIIVCGGREYRDAQTIGMMLARFRPSRGEAVLVHGACRGADMTAAKVALAAGWTVEAHPAEVHIYGSPQAFHIRNQEMVDAGADLLIAFPGGNGTADCTRRARKAEIPVATLRAGDPTDGKNLER